MDAAEKSRTALAALSAQEPMDMLGGALAIAREEYPDLDEGLYARRLDDTIQIHSNTIRIAKEFAS